MMLGAHPMWMGTVNSKPPSPMPNTWIQGTISTSSQSRIVRFADGKFIVTGGNNGYVNSSEDGLTYNVVGVTGPGAQTKIYEYGNSLHVLGWGGTSLYTSPDFNTWTARSIATMTINDIHWSNDLNMFIAVGDSGQMRTSYNGTAWTTRTSGFGSTAIKSVTSGNGIAVITGDAGKVAYSSDGINWTQVMPPGISTIYGCKVDFGGEIFVLAGNDGKIYTSINGSSWMARTNLNTASVDIGSVNNIQGLHIDNNGVAVFVGTQSATSKGIYVTTDFNSYFAKDSGLPDGTQISSITKNGNTWVATGGTAANLITRSISA